MPSVVGNLRAQPEFCSGHEGMEKLSGDWRRDQSLLAWSTHLAIVASVVGACDGP